MADQIPDSANPDMSWIDIAVLGQRRGVVIVDYAPGWSDFIDELHFADVFENEEPDHLDPGVYRWSGFTVDSWHEGNLCVVKGGTFTRAAPPAMDREAVESKFWLIIREPGLVPDQKGPWPLEQTATILREFMAANPKSFIDYLTIGPDGSPYVDHGPQVLQMTDGRSMSVGRKHNARVREAATDALSTLSADAHSDDIAVGRFAALMKAKLAASRAKGRGGWDDPAQCSTDYLRQLLHEHVAKGDPVDVANFCMMLSHYGATTTLSTDAIRQGEGIENGYTADDAVDFVFNRLASKLGLADWQVVEGSEGWEGDVSATLYRLLVDAGIIDDETGAVASLATPASHASDGRK